MARSPSLAKVTAPPSARVVARRSLFRKMDRARRQSRLLWIEAPPGMGKTTLVASWLRERDLPHAWLQLDEADADASAFFHFLQLATGTGGNSRRFAALSPEHLAAPQAYARMFFRALQARRHPPCVVVLDDYHRVRPDSVVHSCVAAGLLELPRHILVVILGRCPPPPALARLRASGEMEFIAADDLALTERESIEIARRWGIARSGIEWVRTLHARAEGWAAGLGLLLGAFRGPGAGWALSTAKRTVFEYFAEEAFSVLDPVTQKVLLETAFSPW